MPAAEAVLLDTHALLWWHAGSERLSDGGRRAIEGADRLFVSPVSCWEVAMLVTKGRIALDRPVRRWVDDLLAGPVQVADLTPRIAVTAGSMGAFGGDPADRLIYVTAAEGDLALVTKDRRLSGFAASEGRVTVVW